MARYLIDIIFRFKVMAGAALPCAARFALVRRKVFFCFWVSIQSELKNKKYLFRWFLLLGAESLAN